MVRLYYQIVVKFIFHSINNFSLKLVTNLFVLRDSFPVFLLILNRQNISDFSRKTDDRKFQQISLWGNNWITNWAISKNRVQQLTHTTTFFWSPRRARGLIVIPEMKRRWCSTQHSTEQREVLKTPSAVVGHAVRVEKWIKFVELFVFESEHKNDPKLLSQRTG